MSYTEKHARQSIQAGIENKITEKIFNCAIKVHKASGPGLLESTYKESLFYKLAKKRIER
jgi:hypothetical protein